MIGARDRCRGQTRVYHTRTLEAGRAGVHHRRRARGANRPRCSSSRARRPARHAAAARRSGACGAPGAAAGAPALLGVRRVARPRERHRSPRPPHSAATQPDAGGARAVPADRRRRDLTPARAHTGRPATRACRGRGMGRGPRFTIYRADRGRGVFARVGAGWRLKPQF